MAAQLDAAVSAVCPIFGVSIGDVNDKTTWRISFRPEATAAQRTAAQTTLNNFVPTPDPDAVGFQNAIKGDMGGIIGSNALAKAYPLFYPALATANWPDVQALILDAKATLVITLLQYAAFQNRAAQFHIPITLP